MIGKNSRPHVHNPERYGVVEFDGSGHATNQGELEITHLNQLYLD